MREDGFTVYEEWDLAKTETFKYKELYHVEPIGIGSPYVESMSSYIKRLANAHGVVLVRFFNWAIIPTLEKMMLENRKYSNLQYSTPPLASAANGANRAADMWMEVLERLTQFKKLHSLTMTTWYGIISEQKLVRGYEAWCGDCYQEWQEQAKVIYQPLLWFLTPITVCPKHKVLLCFECNYCGNKQKLTCKYSSPGYCLSCGKWLGSCLTNKRKSTLVENKSEQQLWFSKATGNLLVSASKRSSSPSRKRLMRAFSKCLNSIAGGCSRTLANQLQVSTTTINLWKQGKVVPSLELLLRLCFEAKVSLLGFLNGRINEVKRKQ